KISEPFTHPDWVFELKWDGFRIIAKVINGKAHLFSRSLLDYTKNYGSVTTALSLLTVNAVIDGEVVVINENGKPDFDALQAYDGRGDLVYYVFDLLWLDGYDITALPITERKQLLREILPDNPAIRLSDTFKNGIDLFNQVTK